MVAARRARRVVPVAAVLPEEARLAADRKVARVVAAEPRAAQQEQWVAARAVAVEPQAAQQEQWAAAPTLVAARLAAEVLQVAARPEPQVVVQRAAARLAVVVRAAHKVAVRAAAEVAAVR